MLFCIYITKSIHHRDGGSGFKCINIMNILAYLWDEYCRAMMFIYKRMGMTP